MFLIPLRLSEPSPWHRPIGTWFMMGCLVVVYFALGPERSLALAVRGKALRPWEWLTHAFVHAGLLHLLGNLLFLFFFGSVVEGRIGFRVFLPLFGLLPSRTDFCSRFFFPRGSLPSGPPG